MVATLIIGLALTGCTRFAEPGSTAPRGDSPQVVIGIGGGGGAGEVVARLYAGILATRGVDVRLDLDARPRQRVLADLDAGALTLVPESMGGLVDHLEPAWRLEHSDADAAEIFVELSRALPIGLSIADYAESAVLPEAGPPAPAGGDMSLAPTPAAERPDNVVPLFRTGELEPVEIMALNVVAGELTTDDVDAMLEQIASGRSAGEVTGSWVAARLS